MRTHDERERNQPTLGLALARRVAVFAEVSVENPLIRTRKEKLFEQNLPVAVLAMPSERR